MKKTKWMIFPGAILVFVVLFLYQPIKENRIYQRHVELPEVSEISEETLGDNKMVQQAKNTLENAFGVSIDKEDYNISVEYEAGQISNNSSGAQVQNLAFANIGFVDKETKRLKYVVECDTTTGEILLITQQYSSPMGDAYKTIRELQEITRVFVGKMTHRPEEDIIYIDDEIQGSTYRANITMKDTYERYVLYLDAFDGTVFYYLKMI